LAHYGGISRVKKGLSFDRKGQRVREDNLENGLKASCLDPVMGFLFFGMASGMTGSISSVTPSQTDTAKPVESCITILYDNNRFNPQLKTAWGFSCLVKGPEKTILFDTGGDDYTLLNNMKQLGVEPASIDIVVLSHIHGDHTGGLGGFLEKNSRVVVYVLGSFPGNFKKSVMSIAKGMDDVIEAEEICPSVYKTREIGDAIREQALVLRTREGLVILTGCAHPGIINMVRKAKEITGDERVHLVAGGFHLRGEQPSRIESIADELDRLSVQKIAPCHCSGDETRRLFKQKFGSNYIESGVGKRIKLQRLE
jgi:7,8-dihydropterin-6-yl-methyl-4-(beta-D-ribofuranosyl)aminobenzene 5'-phosphate synthase